MMNRLGSVFKVDKPDTKFVNILRKTWYSQNEVHVTEDEIKALLKKEFPNAKSVKVQDVSGGCGAMFNIFVETTEFKGLPVVKQHRAVYEALKEQIKKIHGLHVETKSVK